MKLSELSVRRPVLITMVYVLLLVIASLFVQNLDIALYPSVGMPVISVMVSVEDAGPEEVEMQVTKVLENSLSSLENLSSITSQSSQSSSMVMLEFAYGTDLDEASDSITTLISRISRELPSWAGTPSVMRFDASGSSSFMRLIVNGLNDEDVLKQVAEDTISPLLLRIDGVSQVEVRGSADTQVAVRVDPICLEGYNLTLGEVKNALAARNTQGKVGSITQNLISYSVTLDERYESLDAIRNTVITTIEGANITIDDVATVEMESTTSFREQYLDGSPVVSLSLTNESDSNASTVAKAVKQNLASIQDELPEGVILSLQQDSTTMISSTMQEVYKSALQGVLLAALVIFLFLRNLKATLVISLSMPISILFTLMAMSFFDISINSMSMSGLILGIGMIVDASIIILENTYKYREKNHGSAASAILGSKNMSTAIVASTLTTICVFIPLLIYKNQLEMVGIMFQDLIITVCIALISSLFVAVTLVPALSGSILRLDTRVQKPLRWGVLRRLDSLYCKAETALENAYASSLEYVLKHRLLVIVLLVLLLVFSTQYFGGIGMNLTPQMATDDSISISLTMPSGYTKEATKDELFRVQRGLLEELSADAYTQIMVEVGSGNTGSIEISLPDITEQVYSTTELKATISPLLEQNPRATWTYGGGRGPMNSSPINISVSATDTALITETANQIATIISSSVPSATNVATDLENGSPKILVDIDEQKAQDLGLTMSDIYSTVSIALSGSTASTISTFSSEQTYDLVVAMDDANYTSINDLGSLLLKTNSSTIRLGSIASFSTSTAPASITREDKVRVNHVTASLADGYSANQVQEQVQQALDAQLLIPEGVEVSLGGDMQQMTSYGPTLILIIVLALLLVYAVMAAQFESLVDPFIIFATIPMLLIGVVGIHLVMNQSFTLFSIVGIVALIGVVVNNGIVLIDSINQLVAQKVRVHEACLTAARTRLRPILMTTLTTILGLIPLAFFPGEGSEMMQPIALTFIGGLATGSLLTLFLSPTLYTLLNKRREKRYFAADSLANQLALFDQEGR
ncbi:MAG: efflux RND transporter permease subunit [Spirochaetia bacterium]|nr:efflux RND transporter permease subunit [Spirochaetia bacterium]